jgi:hypothetical protein
MELGYNSPFDSAIPRDISPGLPLAPPRAHFGCELSEVYMLW